MHRLNRRAVLSLAQFDDVNPQLPARNARSAPVVPLPSDLSVSRRSSSPELGPSTRARHTVLEIASRFSGLERLVPQSTCNHHILSDRRRYVEEAHIEAPIMFFVNDPAGCGISCRDALNGRVSGLVGCNDTMLGNFGPSISIVLEASVLHLCVHGLELTRISTVARVHSLESTSLNTRIRQS